MALEAGDSVAIDLHQRRPARRKRAAGGTARREGAARRQVEERRRAARDGAQPRRAWPVDRRDRIEQRRRVGVLRVAKTASLLPCSTIRPAYMTITRSAISATTPRSWVTSTIEEPNSLAQPRSSSRICACTVTSSAVVGSSAMSSAGLQDSAMAITARWRMPPESWCG